MIAFFTLKKIIIKFAEYLILIHFYFVCIA